MNDHRDPNRVPTDQEAAFIRSRLDSDMEVLNVVHNAHLRATASLSAAEANLAMITAQMNAIQAQYVDLSGQYNDALAHVHSTHHVYDMQLAAIHAHKALLHPVRRTPLEILGYIFELAVSTLPMPVRGERLNLITVIGSFNYAQPFRLAAVCRRWRQASLASPRAWSTFVVDFDMFTSRNAEARTASVECILSRSGNAPLHIGLLRMMDVNCYEDEDEDEDGEGEELEQMQLGRSAAGHLELAMQRCAHLNMFVSDLYDDADDSDPLIDVLMQPCPNLLHACLVSYHVSSLPDYGHDCLLKQANKIQSLVCPGLWMQSMRPLPSLTRLQLEDAECSIGQDHVITAVDKVPNLETLHLELGALKVHAAELSPVVCPGLRTLVIEFTVTRPEDQVVCWASRFDTPHIHELVVLGSVPISTRRIQFLSSFRQLRALSKLHFERLAMSDMQRFTETIEAIKTLEFLLLSKTSFTSDGLVTFCTFLATIVPGRAWTNPSLASIRLEKCMFVEDCDAGALLALARLRGTPPVAMENGHSIRRLEKLEVGHWPTQDGSQLQDEIDKLLQPRIEQHS